jgi:hypothetical protein
MVIWLGVPTLCISDDEQSRSGYAYSPRTQRMAHILIPNYGRVSSGAPSRSGVGNNGSLTCSHCATEWGVYTRSHSGRGEEDEDDGSD